MNSINQNILKLNYEKEEFDLIKKVTNMLIQKAKAKYGFNFNYGELKFVVHDRECQFVSVEPKLRLVDFKKSKKHKYPKAIYKKVSKKNSPEPKKDKEL